MNRMDAFTQYHRMLGRKEVRKEIKKVLKENGQWFYYMFVRFYLPALGAFFVFLVILYSTQDGGLPGSRIPVLFGIIGFWLCYILTLTLSRWAIRIYRLARETFLLRSLKSFARRYGLSYNRENVSPLDSSYWHHNMMRETKREIIDVFSGNYRGHELYLFNLGVPILSQGNAPDPWETKYNCIRCCLFTDLVGRFPELRVWPAHRQGKGLEKGERSPEIDFDNLEFSRKYNVKCKSKKIAYAVFHPRMMEFFLEVGDVFMEIERNSMTILLSNAIHLKKLQDQLDTMVEFRELLPAYMFEERVKLPLSAEGQGGKEGKRTPEVSEPCPICGSEMSYTSDHQDHYCWNCGKYLGDMEEVLAS